MFWKSKTKNSGMYNTLSIPANLVNWTQNGTNWNGVLTEATMLANNIDYTRVMNVVPQWSQATNGNGWVTTISRSSADNNIYITLTRGSGGSAANAVTLDTQQTITGDKQFNANVQFNKVVELNNGTTNDCSIAIERGASHANYIGFYEGTTRLGTLGRGSASNQNLQYISEHGDLVLSCPSANSINCSSRKITNVATPTAANDAATKAYADSKIGDWVKIIDNVAINTENTTMTQARDWTNNLNDYTYQTRHTYLVTCKVTGLQNNTDLCFNTIIQTNSGTYDNEGQCVIYDNTGTHSMVIQIHLGNTASKQNKIYYYLPSGFSKADSLALYCWIKDLGEFQNS